MRWKRRLIGCWLGLLVGVMAGRAQSVDSLTEKALDFPTRLFGKIQKKAADLDGRLTRQTDKYLQKMARQEQRLRSKLMQTDLAAAKLLFADSGKQYATMAARLRADTARRAIPLQGQYRSYIDSLQTSLAFFQQNPQLTGSSTSARQSLQQSVSQFRQLQTKMQTADQIKQYIQQRKQQLQQYLQQHTQLPAGVTSAITDYKKQAYYYSQQLQTYKDELNDPGKLLKRGLKILDRVPAWNAFVKKNSMLASLLNIPSGTGGAAAAAPGQGMPTRDQVLAALSGGNGASVNGGAVNTGGVAGAGGMEGIDGANGPNMAGALNQSIQSAQGQVDQLRDKLPGGSGGDLVMPDFKPNSQKTRSFWQRLQWGTNLQSTHANVFYPTTTDLGLSLGYKIDNHNTLGIGVSYKVGWGSDISHVKVTGQGVGLRSFLDMQIKKTWYASGGFEYNYQQPFAIQGFPWDPDAWQKSGLIGVSKIVSMKTRVFKNTKIQLLWDFLSYQQVPKAQPLKFRIGYSF